MWVNLIFLFYKPKASARGTRMHSPWSKSQRSNKGENKALTLIYNKQPPPKRRFGGGCYYMLLRMTYPLAVLH